MSIPLLPVEDKIKATNSFKGKKEEFLLHLLCNTALCEGQRTTCRRFSSSIMCTRDRTQGARSGHKHLYLLNRLNDLQRVNLMPLNILMQKEKHCQDFLPNLFKENKLGNLCAIAITGTSALNVLN